MLYSDLAQQEQDNVLLATKEYITTMQGYGIMKPDISYKIYWVGSFIDGDANEWSDYDTLVVTSDEDSTDIQVIPNYIKIKDTVLMRLQQKYLPLHTYDIRARRVSMFKSDIPHLLLEEHNVTN